MPTPCPGWESCGGSAQSKTAYSLRFCPLCATISCGRSVFPAKLRFVARMTPPRRRWRLPCCHAAGKIFPFTKFGGRAAGETLRRARFGFWGWPALYETAAGGKLLPQVPPFCQSCIPAFVRFRQNSAASIRVSGAWGGRHGMMVIRKTSPAAPGARPVLCTALFCAVGVPARPLRRCRFFQEMVKLWNFF